MAEPDTFPSQQRIVVPFDGHTNGQGFNSDTAERVGTGLVAATVAEDSQASGQTGDFGFHMLTSQQSLENSLNISAEVEARYALFSGGAKSHSMHQSNISAVLHGEMNGLVAGGSFKAALNTAQVGGIQ